MLLENFGRKNFSIVFISTLKWLSGENSPRFCHFLPLSESHAA